MIPIGTLNIRRVTLLLGYNGAGKTTLLREARPDILLERGHGVADVPESVKAHLGLDRGRFGRVFESVEALHRDHLGFDFDLTCVSTGLSSVFPCALAVATGAEVAPSLVAVEQPELGLHPSLHEGLTRWMLGQVYAHEGLRLVIETHSEVILLACILEIIEGRLASGDLAVHWVHRTPSGAAIADHVPFDALGIPQGLWPPDAFSADTELARRINRHRIERGAL